MWSRHELSGTGDRPSTSLSGMKWLLLLVPLAVCAGGSHNEARRATMGPTAAWAR
jgi:hypothetical protein